MFRQIYQSLKQRFHDFFAPVENQSTAIKYRKLPDNFSQRLIFFSRPNESFSVGYSPQDFEELTGVTYLPYLEFEDQRALLCVKKQCARALSLGAITPPIKWLGALYAQELQRGYICPLIIRWIDEELGYGIFAKETIKGGAYVGEYTGVVKRCHLIYSNVNEYCFHYPIYNLFFNVHTIDSQNKGNEIRYMNHSNHPNCESVIVYHDGLLHVCIRAKEEIPTGTELTFDYGHDWWGDRKVLE